MIFTNGDIYRFLTSARWRASLPGDRVLQARTREISARFHQKRGIRVWGTAWIKIALNLAHTVVEIKRGRDPRAHVRASNLFFENIRTRSVSHRHVFDVISRRTRSRDSSASVSVGNASDCASFDDKNCAREARNGIVRIYQNMISNNVCE